MLEHGPACSQGYHDTSQVQQEQQQLEPNFSFGLSVFGASADLSSVHCFLRRSYKRKYTSKKVNVKERLQRQAKQIIFKRSSNYSRVSLYIAYYLQRLQTTHSGQQCAF